MAIKGQNISWLTAAINNLSRLFHGQKTIIPPYQLIDDENQERGEISLGDLLTVVKDLPWKNEEQLRKIVRTLGFSWDANKAFEPPGQPKSIYDRSHYAAQSKPLKTPQAPRSTISAPPPPELPVELPPQLLSSELTPRQDVSPPLPPPDWLTQQTNSLLSTEEKLTAVIRQSLFPKNTSRGILSAALAVKRRGGNPDVEKIITTIVRGEILRDLPRTVGTTLEQGCQLLLDYSDNMSPYWDDLNELAIQIEQLLGKARLRVYDFEDHPLKAQNWTSSTELESWQPETSRPIVAASTLGVSRLGHAAVINRDWQKFIRRCEAAACPLLLLIPWQRQYWPVGLGSYPIMIHWNPRTTASMVRQLIGAGHEVKR